MIEISIVDEINCTIDGLAPHELRALIDSLKFPESGAFMTSAYKLGMWDGYTSMISEDGSFMFYHLDHVVEFLYERGYTDGDIDLDDMRDGMPIPSNIPLIDEGYLIEELGYTLRQHQIDGINNTILYLCGILDLATNAGKTAICLGISKALDPYIKTLIVPPTNYLVNQTYKDYQKAPALKSAAITSSDSKKKRIQKLRENDHIIMTSKLFQNLIEEIAEQQFALIIDEAHIFGEVMEQVLRFEVPHFPVRMGLTGTVPTDKLKLEKLKAHLNGDVIGKISPKELIEKGYASVPYIHDVVITHHEINALFTELKSQNSGDDLPFDWSVEFSYLNDNFERAKTIADYINGLHEKDPKNTLILCHPGLARVLGEIMDIPFIVDEVSDDERNRQLGRIQEDSAVLQISSFGTGSTGISIDWFTRMVLIDLAENETRVFQSIGRGIRLDGKANEVEIHDVSSDTIYSKKHRTSRKKMYRQQDFETVTKTKLEI